MAALHSSKEVGTAVVSKLYPMRSHTGAAAGGIAALVAAAFGLATALKQEHAVAEEPTAQPELVTS